MKVGRNEPCPCGSGQKFKKCHDLSGGWPPAAAEPTRVEKVAQHVKKIVQKQYKKTKHYFGHSVSVVGGPLSTNTWPERKLKKF